MTDARPHEDDENQAAPQPVWAKPPTTNDAFSQPEEPSSGPDAPRHAQPDDEPAVQPADQSAGQPADQSGGQPAGQLSGEPAPAPRYAPPPQFSQPSFGQPSFGQPSFGQPGSPPPPAPTWARAPEPAQGGFAAPGWGFADPSGQAPDQSGTTTPLPAGGAQYPAPTQPTPSYADPGYQPYQPYQPGSGPDGANPGQGPGQGQNPGQGPVPGFGPGPDQAPGAGPGDAAFSLDQPAPGDHYAWGGPPPSSGPGTARTRRGGAFIALLVAVCLVAGALGGVAGAALLNDMNDSDGRNPTITLPQPAKDTTPAGAVTRVADAVLPSVVSIRVRSSTEEGTGSGFVIDAGNGYILTNNHVVTAGSTKPATDIQVVFQDGTQVPGKVVGLDASYDLAVVKVQAKGLRTLELGDSDAVRVGDPVIAIGAPLGLQGTVTTGIVSALNRPVAAGDSNTPAFINAIQTDAAINPGNSGGPLVDSTGKVIGINSAIARSPGSTSDTGGNIGLGFSIPSNQARRTAQELIRTGKARHPIIGVTLDDNYSGEGVKVSQQAVNGNAAVTAGGPADQAGIKPGDVITKFNGRPVTEPDELIVAIRARTPGETITLTVRRNGSDRQVRVKLSASSD